MTEWTVEIENHWGLTTMDDYREELTQLSKQLGTGSKAGHAVREAIQLIEKVRAAEVLRRSKE